MHNVINMFTLERSNILAGGILGQHVVQGDWFERIKLLKRVVSRSALVILENTIRLPDN